MSIRLNRNLIATLMLLACWMPCGANASKLTSIVEDSLTQKQRELGDLQAKLQTTSQEKWQDADVQLYLSDALWVVYLGAIQYRDANDSLPTDLTTITGQNIDRWPDNPFNGWKPIRVLPLSGGFAPGDLTLQVCPQEFYSGLDNPHPMSFELSIFGPTKEFGVVGDPKPLKSNTWATTPEGALYQVGAHRQSAAKLKQKIEQQKQHSQGGATK